MTVAAFGSVKSSPGVTTAVLALAAAWPADRSLLVVEADPDGGVLAARTGLGVEPGIATLAAAGRHTLPPGEVSRHTQDLPGGVATLTLPADPDEAARALNLVGSRLAEVIDGVDGDVLVDVGRIRPRSPSAPLLRVADEVVLLARPWLEELQYLPPRIAALRADGVDPSMVLVGERPYPPAEVADVLGVEVLAALADDEEAAAVLAGRTRRTGRFLRSGLLRSATVLADRLTVGSGDASHRADLDTESAAVTDTPAVTDPATAEAVS